MCPAEIQPKTREAPSYSYKPQIHTCNQRLKKKDEKKQTGGGTSMLLLVFCWELAEKKEGKLLQTPVEFVTSPHCEAPSPGSATKAAHQPASDSRLQQQGPQKPVRPCSRSLQVRQWKDSVSTQTIMALNKINPQGKRRTEQAWIHK